jgi:hypothetical protein
VAAPLKRWDPFGHLAERGSRFDGLLDTTGVDAKSIKASTQDGLVELTMPAPEEKKSKRVTITQTTG